jgi:hypothetical protein
VHLTEYFVYISSTGCISHNFSFTDIGTFNPAHSMEKYQKYVFLQPTAQSEHARYTIMDLPNTTGAIKKIMSDLRFSQQCC